MIEQKQLFRHHPSRGEIGDCHRTAIACLLHLRPDEVPHFGELSWDHERNAWADPCPFQRHVTEYLASVGLAEVNVAYQDSLENVLAAQRATNPRAYYLLGGHSRTEVNHTVICCGGSIVWDPSLDDAGIVGPCQPDGLYWVTYLVPLSMVVVA